jgi:hypothetical protein
LSGEGDATFVVCTKRGVMENPENDNKELSETEEDVFEEDNAMAGTYVKETKPKENPASGNKNSWVIELEMSNSDSDEVPPTEMLPGPDSTFALPKKNVGKTTKANKGKDSEADNDKETTNQQDSEEEEVQVFEAPPKTPPLCINLDDTPNTPEAEAPTNKEDIITIVRAVPRRMRPKLLQFHENRRPAYWGTWGKTSHTVGPRSPFGKEVKKNQKKN